MPVFRQAADISAGNACSDFVTDCQLGHPAFGESARIRLVWSPGRRGVIWKRKLQFAQRMDGFPVAPKT
jgi:hypothetical protein